MRYHVTFLGAATSWGSAYRGPEQAPIALWAGGLVQALERPHVTVDWHGILEPSEVAPDNDIRLDVAYPMVSDMSFAVAREVSTILAEQPLTMPIVIGGDHSVAIGTWSGVISSLNAMGQFGLLWIDAHMDAHTPITSVQGAWGGHMHGMPLAHLLGHGDKDLCEIGSRKEKIKGKHLVLIGVRSFEPGEEKLLRDVGATVFTMDDIAREGLRTIMEKAMAIMASAPKGWGISLDLDVFDPAQMPCVGTPEPGGLDVTEFTQCWSAITLPSQPKAVEIVEYIPQKDPTGAGMQMIEQFLWLLLKK